MQKQEVGAETSACGVKSVLHDVWDRRKGGGTGLNTCSF